MKEKKWYIDPSQPSSIRERRIRKTEKINGMQLMPQLAKLSYRCMLILPMIVIVLEIIQFFYFSQELGILYLIQRCVFSTLISWGFFEIVLVFVSLIQLRRLKAGHVETVYINRDPGDFDDPFEPAENPEAKYYDYLKNACIGGLVLLVLYGVLYLTGI